MSLLERYEVSGAPKELPVGSCLSDRYIILDSGTELGFFRKYRALDNHSNRNVHVWLDISTKPITSESVEYYRNKWTEIAGLYPANILRILDERAITEDCRYWVVEYFEGPSLVDLIEDRVLTLSALLELLLQVVDVLEFAYQRGLAHGSLDVAAIGVRELRGERSVFLSPLSVFNACLKDNSTRQNLHISRNEWGMYIPNIDDQVSDVFSLGLLLWKAVFGRTFCEEDAKYSILQTQIALSSKCSSAELLELESLLKDMVLCYSGKPVFMLDVKKRLGRLLQQLKQTDEYLDDGTPNIWVAAAVGTIVLTVSGAFVLSLLSLASALNIDVKPASSGATDSNPVAVSGSEKTPQDMVADNVKDVVKPQDSRLHSTSAHIGVVEAKVVKAHHVVTVETAKRKGRSVAKDLAHVDESASEESATLGHPKKKLEAPEPIPVASEMALDVAMTSDLPAQAEATEASIKTAELTAVGAADSDSAEEVRVKTLSPKSKLDVDLEEGEIVADPEKLGLGDIEHNSAEPSKLPKVIEQIAGHGDAIPAATELVGPQSATKASTQEINTLVDGLLH